MILIKEQIYFIQVRFDLLQWLSLFQSLRKKNKEVPLEKMLLLKYETKTSNGMKVCIWQVVVQLI